jgi:Big-like domain-containing protein/carboxypeptidase family protein/PA14 domain-containing protein
MRLIRSGFFVALIAVLSVPLSTLAQQRKLAELDIPLRSVFATVENANPVVPKNVASAVRIVVKFGDQELSRTDAARFLGDGFAAQAELSGPGLGQTITLPYSGDPPPTDPLLLPLPALSVSGDYTLTNIRLVSAGRTVMDVSPATITVKVIEQILITSVKTRALTLAEIKEKGIVIDNTDYRGFEFTLGVAGDSKTVNVTLPVVFDRQGVVVPLPPAPLPVSPARATVEFPTPTFVPMLLETDPCIPGDGCDFGLGGGGLDDGSGGSSDGLDLLGLDPVTIQARQNPLRLPTGEPIRIPALLVIPGNTGYLKQFFSAQLFVSNGAPGGSGLVVRDVTGTITLPPGDDLEAGTADDPLALPSLERRGQTIVQPTTMKVLGVGADGQPGTADDVDRLDPGDQAQAEFLLRGEREGFQPLAFDIRAVLEGLPVGPVTVKGKASGGVLVRNPFFNMTFALPSVTRRGEPFKLYTTVTNIGQGIGNDVTVTLDPSRMSGATLVGDATKHIDTLRTGDAQTVAFDFIAQRTGKAVATYLHFDAGAATSGDLKFSLAVNDQGVALSPDTLALPSAVDLLPAEVVEAAMRVLGQAWSNANAPAGTLPSGVLRISKAVATEKALALAEAGLRMTLGQSAAAAVRDIAVDFYGGSAIDPAFDQLLRQTEAGHALARAIGAASVDGEIVAGGIIPYEKVAAEIAASGKDFISFAVGDGSGAAPLDISLVDALGRRTVPDASAGGVPPSNVPGAVFLPIGPGTAPAPLLGRISNPSSGPYTIEWTGRSAGPFDLSLTQPLGDGTFIRTLVSGAVTSGSRGRLLIDLFDPASMVVEEDLDGDGTFESRRPLTFTPLTSQGPQLVSATVIGPETLDGASPFGFHTVLLFDRLVDPASAADRSHYQIPQNSVVNAKRQLSGRLVFTTTAAPEGPYVHTTVAVTGVSDLRGIAGSPMTMPLRSRLADPGGVITGRVFRAGGGAVPTATIYYSNNAVAVCPTNPLDALQVTPTMLGSQPVGPDGRFEFRYVRQDSCGAPWQMGIVDAENGARRAVSGFVHGAGEQIVLDIPLLGRGSVTGVVRTLNGSKVPGAQVVALSDGDAQSRNVGVTDADGRYVISGISVGQVSVKAVKGANAGRSSGRIDRAGTTTAVDITLDSGAAHVAGRVLKIEHGITGAAPGVFVTYELASGGGPLALTQTAGDGSFQFDGVPIGSFIISAAIDSLSSGHVNGVLAVGDNLTGQDVVVVVVPPPTLNLDELGGGSGGGGGGGGGGGTNVAALGGVRGIVRLPNGTPAPGVTVSLGARAVLSQGDGTFAISVPVVFGADQTLSAQTRDGLRSGTALVRMSAPAQIVDGVVIVLSGVGSVVFKVVDPFGQPIAGQTVGLLSGCASSCGCSGQITAADGTVRFDGRPSGSIQVKAIRTILGFTDVATASAAVGQDGDVGTATLRFAGFGSVVGTVTTPDGLVAGGATIDLDSRVFNAQACDLVGSRAQSMRTRVDGTFAFSGVPLGPVQVTAAAIQPFYPNAVSRQGTITQNGQEINLPLVLSAGVSVISGELSGTVFLPDGVTPAGAGVELTMDGPLSGVVVTTNADGHYRFAKVFPEGAYTQTVRDPITGGLAQQSIYLTAGQDAIHDVRLKGTGTVRVRVVDGSDQPVAQAFARVREGAFPSRSFEGVIDASNLGVASFTGVFEGPISIDVSDSQGRGGRAGATMPPPGATVDVKVTLSTTGTVTGHFVMPDGTTPIPFATVTLTASGRTIGQATTQGSGDVGAFSFEFVPAGPVQLDALDPATARTGFAAGTIATDGQVLTLDVHAQSLGAVGGLVTSNGSPQAGANVEIIAGSFHTRSSSDFSGHYRVTGVPEGRVVVTASLGDGFLAGTASAQLQGEGTDLNLDVALRSSGRVEGRVISGAGGASAPTSVVTIQVGGTGGGSFTTTTQSDGSFVFDRVPSGLATFDVRVLGGIDEARATADVPAGGTATVTISLNGLGSVSGRALDSSGMPAVGDVRISATGAIPFAAAYRTSSDGGFYFAGVPAGPITLTLTIGSGSFALYGAAAATVVADQRTEIDVQVQPAGTVTGRILRADGTTSAANTQVTLTLDAGRGTVTLYSQVDGHFESRGVPLGGFELRMRDFTTAGVALVQGNRVESNGQIVDVGDIVLDDTDVVLVSMEPADGALGVAVNQAIRVIFSDPLASAAGVMVLDGTTAVPLAVSLSADRRTVTLTGTLPDGKLLALVATSSVVDVYGRYILHAVTTHFTTADLTPPVVMSLTPAPAAIQVVPTAPVTVTFNEPLATSADLSGLIALSGPAGPVTGVTTLTSPTVATFTPSGALAGNSIYTVTVNGAVDLAGNTQTIAFVSTFATIDTVAPVLTLNQPSPNSWTTNPRPLIEIATIEQLSGIDPGGLTVAVDGNPLAVTLAGSAIRGTPASALPDGQHTVAASVRDRAGNTGTLSAGFGSDTVAPSAALFTGAAEGGALRGVVTLTASATDGASGVDRIRTFADGVMVATTIAPTFGATYDSHGLTEGVHIFTAQATDRAGNIGPIGPPVHVVVDNQALTLTITSPLTGAAVRASVVVTATTSEPVARVEFAVGALTVVDDTAPYSATLDLTGVPEGSVLLTATAVGLLGETARVTRQVVIDPPPMAHITSPAPGSVLLEGATIPIVVEATDNVAVARVDLSVNGQVLASDSTTPFQFLFTVPVGVTSLTFAATAADNLAQSATSSNVVVSVLPDPLTTVQGTTVDGANVPLAGAQVVADLSGLTAEAFNFQTPLTTLPNLTGLTANRTKIVSTPNMPNPNLMFGSDPFGFGPAFSRTVRLTGTLGVAAPGTYTFSLRVNAGGRLTIGGTQVIDLASSTGAAQEATGAIALAAGRTAIELLFVDNGNPELVLRYQPPGGEMQVIPPSLLVPAVSPFESTSGPTGAFSISGVPTALGNVSASATIVTAGGTFLSGRATPIVPTAGGITNLGSIRLTPKASTDPSITSPITYTLTPQSVGGATLTGSFTTDGTLGQHLTPTNITSASVFIHYNGQDLDLGLPGFVNPNPFANVDFTSNAVTIPLGSGAFAWCSNPQTCRPGFYVDETQTLYLYGPSGAPPIAIGPVVAPFAVAQAAKPIVSVSPNPGFIGWPVTITGAHFGDLPRGVSALSSANGGYNLAVLSWNKDEIQMMAFAVPLCTYALVVTTSDGQSSDSEVLEVSGPRNVIRQARNCRRCGLRRMAASGNRDRPATRAWLPVG